MAISTGHWGGNGGSINFGTSAFQASIISISGFEQSREALDTSHLDTANFRSKIPGDLTEPGSFDIEFYFDAEDHNTTDDLPPINGAAETIYIDLPLTAASGTTTEARFTASGFLTSWTSPELATDQLMVGSATVQWATGPTYTEEA